MELIILDSKENKQQALRALMAVMAEDGMELVLRKRTDHDGTKQQKAWFNILCGIIAKDSGHTPAEIRKYTERIKTAIKKQTFGMEVSEVMGVKIEFVPRSGFHGKDGYSQLIECAYRFGAQLNIVLPNPARRA